MSSWWQGLHVLSALRQRHQRKRIRRMLVLGIEKFEDRRLLAGVALAESLQPSLVGEARMVELSAEELASPPESGVLITPGQSVAGFQVSRTMALVHESGTTGEFTVVLTAQPDSDVVLTINSGDTSEVAVNPAVLVFTLSNWSSPQSVTLTGCEDHVVDSSQQTLVTISVADEFSDDNFDPLEDKTVNVITMDDDWPGFTLSKNTATVAESGTEDTFTVVLTAEPDTDVVLKVTSADAGEVMASPAALTFTPADWNSPQTVTLTGVADDVPDYAQMLPVAVSVDVPLSDDMFDAVPPQSVMVFVTDIDVPGFALSAASATVSEQGSTATFTAHLTARPQSNVTLNVSSADTGEVTVASATLTFTPADWNSPQTVTLTGVADFVVDGSQTTLVTVSVVASTSDDAFDPLPAQGLLVTTTDDDLAGLRLSKHAASVSENGTTDEFTVSLTARPGSNVTVTVISTDPGEVTASPAVLVFTPADWNTPQAVTVTGVDDHWIDGSQETRVAVSVAAGVSDGQFAGVAEETVWVTTADNDAAGFRLSKTQARVSENGTTDTFTAVLTAQPLTNVVLEVSSSDPGEAAASPAALTFTPADWNSPQPVTITGVDDSERDGSQSSSVTVSVDDLNSDDLFDGVDSQVVSVSTSDNDSGWHNWENPYDVNGDDLVNASDVLIIVNYINDGTIAPALPPPPAAPPPYYDVNNDGLCTAIDVLIIINFINTYGLPQTSGGEGEGASRDATAPENAAPSDQSAQGASADVPAVSTLPAEASDGQVPLLTLTLWAGGDERALFDSDGVSRLAAPSSAAAARQTNEQRMPIGSTTLGQRAARGPGQTREAVFDAWRDDRWDDLAGTLAPDIGRAG